MVRFQGLPVKKLLLYGSEWIAKKTYLPIFSCNTGEFTFEGFLADFSYIFLKKSRIQLCDLSIYKRTKRTRTAPNHSCISRFPLEFLEEAVQDSYSPFAFPESFLSVVVVQADLEELE